MAFHKFSLEKQFGEKWAKNQPVRLFSCNIFLMKSYYFIFQLFLKKYMVLILCHFNFQVIRSLTLLYISENCSFCIATPIFQKWVKNDSHSCPMEFHENFFFLSTVTVKKIYFVGNSVTSSEDYFIQQELTDSIHLAMRQRFIICA